MDAWLRAGTLFRIGASRRAELAGQVLAAFESDDALVRETALVAGRTVLDPERFEAVVRAQTEAVGNLQRLSQKPEVD